MTCMISEAPSFSSRHLTHISIINRSATSSVSNQEKSHMLTTSVYKKSLERSGERCCESAFGITKLDNPLKQCFSPYFLSRHT